MARQNLIHPRPRTHSVNTKTALRIAAGTGLVVTLLICQGASETPEPVPVQATGGFMAVPTTQPQTQPATQPTTRPAEKKDQAVEFDGKMASPRVYWKVEKETPRG